LGEQTGIGKPSPPNTATIDIQSLGHSLTELRPGVVNMEAVGLAASIVSLIEVTTKVVKYLDDVKDAPKERAELASEANILLGLLHSLKNRVDQANLTDPWFVGLQSLDVPGGLLHQYKESMHKLAKKLEPAHGVKKVGKALVWAIDKQEVKEVLTKIERLKTTIGLELQKDHL